MVCMSYQVMIYPRIDERGRRQKETETLSCEATGKR